MNENNKIKLAKNIKSISKLFLFSLIIGILSYLILPIFNSGYNAILLKNNFKDKCTYPSEECSEFQNKILVIGEKEKTTFFKTDDSKKLHIFLRAFDLSLRTIDFLSTTVEKSIEIKDFRDYVVKENKLSEYNKWIQGYNNIGKVQKLKYYNWNNEEFVHTYYIDYNVTIQRVIDKSFGRTAIINSFKIFIYLFCISVLFKIVLPYSKMAYDWVLKYSK